MHIVDLALLVYSSSNTMPALAETELEAVKTAGHAAQIAKLEGAHGDKTAVLGSLLSLLGATIYTPIGAIGMIPVEDYDRMRQAWTVDVPASDGAAATPRPPTLVEIGKGMARIVRARLGLEATAASTAHAPAAVPTPVSSTGIRRIKMNQILPQLDETEIDVVSSTEQLRMFARYE